VGSEAFRGWSSFDRNLMATLSLINRKIKNKICGAGDWRGVGLCVTAGRKHILRPLLPARDPIEVRLPAARTLWALARRRWIIVCGGLSALSPLCGAFGRSGVVGSFAIRWLPGLNV
jgi:hypothetical protein